MFNNKKQIQKLSDKIEKYNQLLSQNLTENHVILVEMLSEGFQSIINNQQKILKKLTELERRISHENGEINTNNSEERKDGRRKANRKKGSSERVIGGTL